MLMEVIIHFIDFIVELGPRRLLDLLDGGVETVDDGLKVLPVEVGVYVSDCFLNGGRPLVLILA